MKDKIIELKVAPKPTGADSLKEFINTVDPDSIVDYCFIFRNKDGMLAWRHDYESMCSLMADLNRFNFSLVSDEAGLTDFENN